MKQKSWSFEEHISPNIREKKKAEIWLKTFFVFTLSPTRGKLAVRLKSIPIDLGFVSGLELLQRRFCCPLLLIFFIFKIAEN